MALPFEFVVNRNPVSQRATGRNRWVNDVGNIARQHWPAGEKAVDDAVAVTIVFFHDNLRIDVDNVAKPILDALTEVVFEDDSQVADLMCRKRNLNDAPTVVSGSSILVAALSQGQPFVYILVEYSQAQEINV